MKINFKKLAIASITALCLMASIQLISFTVGSTASEVKNNLDANSFIGVSCHFAQDSGDPEILLPLVKNAGIRSIRDEYYWGSVEKSKGVYTFNYDKYLDVALDNGLEPLVIMSYGNDLYEGGAAPSTDESIAAYANYCKAVAGHLKDKVKYFEIWNEWNGGMGNSKLLNAEAYCRLIKAAYEAIKQANPDAKVVGGVTCLADYGWVDQLLKAGGGQYMDIFSYHPYNSSPESGAYVATIKEMKGVLEKGGFTGSAWITEIGWGNGDTAKGGLSELTTAGYVIQTNIMTMVNPGYVDRVFFYELQDNGAETMGILNQDNSPKLAYTALTAYTKELAGAEFVDSYELDGNLSLYRFRRDSDKKDILVAWTVKDPMTVGLKLGCDKLDYVDILGETNSITTVKKVLNTTISNVPVYFVGKFSKNISLAEPGFKLDTEIKNIAPGDTFEVKIERTKDGARLAGHYEVSLPEGWSLLNDKSLTKGNKEDVLQIKTPDQLIQTSYINIQPVDDSGQVRGNLTVTAEKVEPFHITVAPKPEDTTAWSKWGLDVNLKNNYSLKTLSGGTVSVLAPEKWVDGKAYPYTELKPGDSSEINIPLSTIDLSVPESKVIPVSQDKPASTDSEETGKENFAKCANDGNTNTRWCASDGNMGHWWMVDLQEVYDITGTEAVWEFDNRIYKYKIEVSEDNKNWVMAADNTNNTRKTQTQRDIFNIKGRYVRVTVTGSDQGSWACLWEFRVYDSANPMPQAELSKKLQLEVKPADGAAFIIEKNVTFLAATYAENAIEIDGDISGPDWQDTMPVTVNKAGNIKQMADWGGQGDLSMILKTKWDTKYLYIGALVTDNVHCQPYTSSSIWQADGLQIALDPCRLDGPGTGGYSETGFAINVDNIVQKYRWTALPGRTAGNFNQAECAVSLKQGMVVYEIAVPWSEILPDGISASENMDIGFSMLANDNDGEKRRGWIEYNSGIGQGKDPLAFGDLILANPNGYAIPVAAIVNDTKVKQSAGESTGFNWMIITVAAALLFFICSVAFLFVKRKRAK